MKATFEERFKRNYDSHLKHLRLKGLQPKTIEAYSRAIRRIGIYFHHQIDDLSEAQLTDYFTDLLESYSWSAVKLDLYGFKFYYTHVLRKPWVAPNLIKPPKAKRLPDIVTVEEAHWKGFVIRVRGNDFPMLDGMGDTVRVQSPLEHSSHGVGAEYHLIAIHGVFG